MKKWLFLLMLLEIYSICGFSQTGKENIEKDGFIWYEVKTKRNSPIEIQNAERVTIIPQSRGYLTVTYNSGMFIVTKEGKEGVCDINGDEIIPPTIYDDVLYRIESADGFEYFKVRQGKNKGICSITGKEIIPSSIYNDVQYLINVSDSTKYYQVTFNGKKGICDTNGKEIIAPTKYDEVFYIFDKEDELGFYMTKVEERNGVCDAKGNEIVAPKYEKLFYSATDHDYMTIVNGEYVTIKDLESGVYVPSATSTSLVAVSSTPEKIIQDTIYEKDYVATTLGEVTKTKDRHLESDGFTTKLESEYIRGEKRETNDSEIPFQEAQGRSNSLYEEREFEQLLELADNKDYKKAIKRADALLKHSSNTSIIYLRGYCYYHRGKWKGAIKDFEKVIEMGDCSEEFLNNATNLLASAKENRQKQLEQQAMIWTAALTGLAQGVENAQRARSNAYATSTQPVVATTNYTQNTTKSSTYPSTTRTTKKKNEPDFTGWKRLERAYNGYEDQLVKMKTSPENYSKQDFKDIPHIQSEMKRIREKLKEMGAPGIVQSPLETWRPKNLYK